MNEAFKHLVAVDVPGIKDYVFGTDKLVEIRGASALLDNLNRSTIPERIEKRFGEARSTCVFACGGAAQFHHRRHPGKHSVGTKFEPGSFFSEMPNSMTTKQSRRSPETGSPGIG